MLLRASACFCILCVHTTHPLIFTCVTACVCFSAQPALAAAVQMFSSHKDSCDVAAGEDPSHVET